MTEWLARTLANTMLVSSLSLAAILWYKTVLKGKRDPLTITSFSVLTLGGILGWFAVPHYNNAWTIAAVLTFILSAATYYLASQISPKRTRTVLQVALLTGLLVAPLVPIWQYRTGSDPVLTNAAAAANKQALDKVSAEISREAEGVRQIADDLVTSDFFIKAQNDKTVAGLGTDLQRYMLEKDLDTLTVTNGQGTVVIRAQQPGSVGESSYSNAPWAYSAYEGKAQSGLAVNEQGLPSVSAAIPVGPTLETPDYVVSVGKTLNEEYLATLKERIGSGIAITPTEGQRTFITGDPEEQTLYRSAYLATDIRTPLRTRISQSDTNPFATYLDFKEDQFVATTIPLTTLNGGGIIGATVLHKDSPAIAWPLYILAVCMVGLFGSTIWPTLANLISHLRLKKGKRTTSLGRLSWVLPLALIFPLFVQSTLTILTIPAIIGKGVEGTTVSVQDNDPGPSAFLSFGRVGTLGQPLNQGQVERLPVKVDSGGGNVGVVHAEILYQPDRITVQSIQFDGSFCAGANQSIDANAGRIRIDCTAPTPSFSGQIGTLANLQIQTKQPGTALFWFDPQKSTITGRAAESKSLLAGTRLTRVETSGNPIESPAITSPSHPLFNGCQTSATAELHWIKTPSTHRFEYAWTEQFPTDNPSQSTVSTTLNMPVKPGTVHWLSLRTVRADGARSAVNHYRVEGCTP